MRIARDAVGCLVALAAVLGAEGAYASGVSNPNLAGSATITNGSTNTWNLNSTAYVDNGDGTFTYAGSNNAANPVWSFSWNITVDPDPLISSTLTIINKTSVTKHFDILFTLPVGSPFASGLKSGSMSASFEDFNGNGSPANGIVSLSNIDWSGRIDGLDAMFLYTFDGSCGPGSPGCSGSLGTVSDGPLPHPAGVSSSIGIHLAFDLTAGDKAIFANYFEVVPTVVPLPGAIWLFGAGSMFLAAFIRKKKISTESINHH